MAPSMLLALRLVLVYPGAPGSPQEAEGFLDTLGGYLEKRAGLPRGGLAVTFHNDVESGLADLASGPALAVATLPALCQGSALEYRYLCSPRIAGRTAETVSLVAKAGTAIPPGDAAVTALKGRRIAGPLLGHPAYVNRLVLLGRIDVAADATIVPAPTALLAVKAVREGQADVALLSQAQVEALGSLVAPGALVTLWTSPPIPGAPLVALGAVPEQAAAAVARAFQGMCTDPEGAELCDTMGVTGFDADGAPALAAALGTCWGLPPSP